MKKFTQIKYSEELAGKTIERFIESEGKIFIYFNDDFFAVIEPTGYDIRSCELKESTYHISTEQISNLWDLYNAGLLEKEEYNQLITQAKERDRIKKEEQDRRLYEELKTKFS